MRKLFLLFSLSLVVSLAFAPTAGAQTTFPQSDGSGDTIGDGCPAGEFAAIPPNTLGEGGFACFGTQEEADYYAETGEQLPEGQQAQNGGQDLVLGNSRAAAYDPANYDRSEINPNGPCFDPELSGDVTGVPVEDLPLAYVNRNDPAGTPTVSPLDSNNDGIACNALTQAEAQAIADGDTAEDQDADNEQAPARQYDDDEMTELPDTGGPALLLPVGGLALMGLGFGTLFLGRRLN